MKTNTLVLHKIMKYGKIKKITKKEKAKNGRNDKLKRKK